MNKKQQLALLHLKERLNENWLKKTISGIALGTSLLSNPSNKVSAEPISTTVEPPQPKFAFKDYKDFAERRKDGQLRAWDNMSDFNKKGEYLKKYLEFLKKNTAWLDKYGSDREKRKNLETYKEIEDEYNEWVDACKTHVEPEKEIVDSRKTKNKLCGSKEGEAFKKHINSLQYK